jgi:hypothetical protein
MVYKGGDVKEVGGPTAGGKDYADGGYMRESLKMTIRVQNVRPPGRMEN